jgi:hypothetical protein
VALVLACGHLSLSRPPRMHRLATMSTPAWRAFFLVGWPLVWCAAHPHHHPQGEGCAMCPHHSDVVATSRSAHYAKVHGTYDTWEAMAAFDATRLDWVYSTNASFVAEAHKRGLEITLAMNPQCKDPHPSGNDTNTIGRVLNIHGERLVAPWMRQWSGAPRYYGCVNNPDYLKIAFDFGAKLLSLGSDGIQHDDPGANGEAVTWDQGDPTLSGCYCEHCMTGFTKVLLSHLSGPDRARLNVTESFNYKDLLLREAWNGTSPAVRELRPIFVQYQQNVSERCEYALMCPLPSRPTRSTIGSSHRRRRRCAQTWPTCACTWARRRRRWGGGRL